MVENPDYAAYVMAPPEEINRCFRYINCEVVVVPYIVDTVLGGGWLFPKGSPYLPIMEFYASAIKEGGIYGRTSRSYIEGAENPVCTNYDGKPIGLHKAFSLSVIIFLGLGLSLLILL